MTQAENDAAAHGWKSASGWLFVAFGAISGATAMSAAAFAMHGLNPATQAHQIELMRTGSQYDLVHALAMLATAALAAVGRLHLKWAAAAQWLFLAGGMLFAGTLYLLGLGAPESMAASVPIGGTAYILGWLSLTIAALLRYRR